MAWRIEDYRTVAGERPVRAFIGGLPRDAKAEADGLFELRRNQVRLFYIFEPGQVIRLLGGMLKKQDRIPADMVARMRGYQPRCGATRKTRANA